MKWSVAASNGVKHNTFEHFLLQDAPEPLPNFPDASQTLPEASQMPPGWLPGVEMVRKMSKMVRNRSRKIIRGFREVRKGQNFAPDSLGALPDPKTAIKITKMSKNVENLENGRISVFFLLPGVGLLRLFLLFGVTRCGHLYI